MYEINSLSKFLSPLISFICGKDAISVPGIVCGTIWGSFPVLGSFAVQFGDHLRYWDHLRAGIICGPAQISAEISLRTGSLRWRKKIRGAKCESGSEASGSRSVNPRAKRVGLNPARSLFEGYAEIT